MTGGVVKPRNPFSQPQLEAVFYGHHPLGRSRDNDAVAPGEKFFTIN